MRLAPLVSVLLLSGCVLPSQAEEDAAPVGAAPTAFTTGACAVQEILFPAAPESLAAFLPEGFEAEAFPAEGMSAVIALVMTCMEPEASAYGMVVIPVTTVPEALRREDADAHAVVTSVVLDEGSRLKATFEAWGYGPVLSAGTAGMEDVLGTPAARAGRAEAATGGGARFAIDTAVRGAPRTDEGNFIRFFMAHDRQVLGAWDGDLTGNHRVHSGEASMEASGYAPLPGSPVAGLGFHEFSDVVTWTRVPAPSA